MIRLHFSKIMSNLNASFGKVMCVFRFNNLSQLIGMAAEYLDGLSRDESKSIRSQQEFTPETYVRGVCACPQNANSLAALIPSFLNLFIFRGCIKDKPWETLKPALTNELIISIVVNCEEIPRAMEIIAIYRASQCVSNEITMS